MEKNNTIPPFLKYDGQESFFGGQPPLSQALGYIIVLGFGAIFSILTTLLMYLDTKYAGSTTVITSEHFNTAGRMVKTGLIANVIVSQWTWAATLLQSSNVAYAYGVSGPFWYASGATIQILLFGVIAISIKKVAPSAHTLCEIVNARWGHKAHLTFLFFAFSANIIVTSMLLLGGAATIEALTGMDYKLASFLIPWGVILYTASGGLKATFVSTYFHTVVIMAVLVVMIFIVYIKVYSSDQIYGFLQATSGYTTEECEAIFSNPETGETFYSPDTYACGPVAGNHEGSYLTMLSGDGFMFGVINIVGNFGTVFVDQSYWQSAIAARPESAAKGYLLGGIVWFSIPFSLATSLGLASTALMLPITVSEASSGLVPPAVAEELLGNAGAVLILVMLFMAITSTGSAESIAVSSLVAYDIYREYFNPEATGEQILKVSRIVIVVFGLFVGCFSIALFEIGLDLGWVYLFMGIMIGSAVFPLWNMMTWEKASGTGAVLAAWGGLILALIGWMSAAKIQSGSVSVDSLGTNEAMLSGNLIAILSSGFIHWTYSTFVDPQDFSFADLDGNIKLVEQDFSGLTETEKDPVALNNAYLWITRRGYALAFILIILWPALSLPIGVFTQSYFAFWVLVSIAWGFAAALVITILPLTESSDELFAVTAGMWAAYKGKPYGAQPAEEAEPVKEIDEEGSSTDEALMKGEDGTPDADVVEVEAAA